jgi:hypothetical protein
MVRSEDISSTSSDRDLVKPQDLKKSSRSKKQTTNSSYSKLKVTAAFGRLFLFKTPITKQLFALSRKNT